MTADKSNLKQQQLKNRLSKIILSFNFTKRQIGTTLKQEDRDRSNKS